MMNRFNLSFYSHINIDDRIFMFRWPNPLMQPFRISLCHYIFYLFFIFYTHTYIWYYISPVCEMVFLTCGPTPWYRQLTTLSSRLISSFWLKSSSCLAAWSANIVIIAGIELCGEQGGNIQRGQSHVKWTFGYTNPNSWPLPPLLRPRTILKALYDLACQCQHTNACWRVQSSITMG